jgi:hypothetical protein
VHSTSILVLKVTFEKNTNDSRLNQFLLISQMKMLMLSSTKTKTKLFPLHNRTFLCLLWTYKEHTRICLGELQFQISVQTANSTTGSSRNLIRCQTWYQRQCFAKPTTRPISAGSNKIQQACLTLFRTLTGNGWEGILSFKSKTFPSKVLLPLIFLSVMPHFLRDLLTTWKNAVAYGNTQICTCRNERKRS